MMKRGQIAIVFFFVFALVATFLLFRDASVTGEPAAPMRIALPQEQTPKTEAEICLLQYMKKIDVCPGRCEADNRACLKKSSANFCSQGYNYCKANCGDGVVLQVKTCMKGMGILI